MVTILFTNPKNMFLFAFLVLLNIMIIPARASDLICPNYCLYSINPEWQPTIYVSLRCGNNFLKLRHTYQGLFCQIRSRW